MGREAWRAIHVGNCVLAYLELGTLARHALAARPAAAGAVTRAAAAAMIGLGILRVLKSVASGAF